MQEKLYNELANYYDLFCFNDYKKQIKFLLNIIRKFKTKTDDKDIRILDLACGTGEHIKLLKNNFIIDGIDGNNGMLKIARKKNPQNKILKGDLNKLRIIKNYYDLIICFSSSIQYILPSSKMIEALKEIFESLKPKGILIFDLVYCREKWIEGYVGMRTIIKNNLQIAEIFKSKSINNISYYNPIYLINDGEKSKIFIDSHKIYLYKIKEMQILLKKTGFRRVKIFGDYKMRTYNQLKNRLPVFLAFK